MVVKVQAADDLDPGCLKLWLDGNNMFFFFKLVGVLLNIAIAQVPYWAPMSRL